MSKHKTYQLFLEKLTPKQCLNIKGPVVDMDNRINEIFPAFDLFNKEFSLRDRLIDIFSSCFSFYYTNRQSKESIKIYIRKLNNIVFQVLADLKSTIVVSDTSIKNQVVTSILHIHVHNNLIIKTIHYTINVISTKAKIFTIRYNIN